MFYHVTQIQASSTYLDIKYIYIQPKPLKFRVVLKIGRPSYISHYIQHKCPLAVSFLT